jgi:hypothetical protein
MLLGSFPYRRLKCNPTVNGFCYKFKPLEKYPDDEDLKAIGAILVRSGNLAKEVKTLRELARVL